MRYAIISDIHSNIQALNKAFSLIDKDNVDEILCLGDIVGYNANPIECIQAIQSHPKVTHVIQGNHDAGAVNVDGFTFNDVRDWSQDAYDGLLYSHSLFSDEHKDWLSLLPEDELIKNDEFKFWISHCSPNYCTLFGYILSRSEAKESMDVLVKYKSEANLFFFGHSHVPTFITEGTKKDEDKIIFDAGRHLDGDTYMIEPNKHYLINPGSIGQPRGNGLTSYAILDTKEKTVKIQGFQYNVEDAQQAVRKAGYSESIANRLDPEYDLKKKQIKKERCKHQQKIADAQK